MPKHTTQRHISAASQRVALAANPRSELDDFQGWPVHVSVPAQPP
jgi:hypothetical protein